MDKQVRGLRLDLHLLAQPYAWKLTILISRVSDELKKAYQGDLMKHAICWMFDCWTTSDRSRTDKSSYCWLLSEDCSPELLTRIRHHILYLGLETKLTTRPHRKATAGFIWNGPTLLVLSSCSETTILGSKRLATCTAAPGLRGLISFLGYLYEAYICMQLRYQLLEEVQDISLYSSSSQVLYWFVIKAIRLWKSHSTYLEIIILNLWVDTAIIGREFKESKKSWWHILSNSWMSYLTSCIFTPTPVNFVWGCLSSIFQCWDTISDKLWLVEKKYWD